MPSSKVQANRKKAGLVCARKLEAAADALNAYLAACRACADCSGDEMRGASDGRIRLVGDLLEYASYLADRYENESA